MYMIRTTLMLPDDLRRKGFDEARRRGISFGEFVRAAMRLALDRAPRSEMVRDSFLDDRATYAGPVPADSSTNHDDYLYGDKP